MAYHAISDSQMDSFDSIPSIETAPVSGPASGPVSAATSFSANASGTPSSRTPSSRTPFKYTRRHVTPMFRGIAGELNREEDDPIVGGLSAREWRNKLNEELLKDMEFANETDNSDMQMDIQR